MTHNTATLGTATVVLLLHAHACFAEVYSSNVVGCQIKPLGAVTGEVATVARTGTHLRQLAGTGIGIEVRKLVPSLSDGPMHMGTCGTWSVIQKGSLGEVLVSGLRIELGSSAIRDGLVRTRDFGDWTIYTYSIMGKGAHLAIAVLIPEDHLGQLRMRIAQGTQEEQVEQAVAE